VTHLCHAVAISSCLRRGIRVLGQLAGEAEVGDPQLAVSRQQDVSWGGGGSGDSRRGEGVGGKGREGKGFQITFFYSTGSACLTSRVYTFTGKADAPDSQIQDEEQKQIHFDGTAVSARRSIKRDG